MKKTSQINPLEGSIVKGMILFALPIMATSFLQVLFSSVDTMVVGKYGSENAMAAVGAGSSIINLIISGIMALNTGISIRIGYHYGKREKEKIQAILQSLLLTSLFIGSVAAILANLFCEPLLRLVHCPESLLGKAADYFRIYFLSLPFMMSFSAFSSVLQAKGKTTPSFVIQIICSITNLFLNLLFVIAFHWDIAGVAIATVISQAISTILILAYFYLMEKEFSLKLTELTIFRNLGEIFRLGIPTSMEGMVMNLSGVVIQSAINGFPEYVISGNTVASSIEGLMCVAFIGFSSGSVVFISQNYGKGNWKRVQKIHRTTTLLVFVLGECIGSLVYLLSPYLIALYTDSVQIAQTAKTRLLFMCLAYGLCGTMNALSGCVQGLGDTKTPLKISLLTSCGFRILWICVIAKQFGTVSSIYVSYPVCWFLSSSLYYISFWKIFHKISAATQPNDGLSG